MAAAADDEEVPPIARLDAAARDALLQAGAAPGTLAAAPGEEVRLTVAPCRCVVGTPPPATADAAAAAAAGAGAGIIGAAAGAGTLFVTTRRVLWLTLAGGDGAGGYAFAYPAIGLHAVCRDPTGSGFDAPCIYLQVDGDDGANNDGEEGGPVEVRLAPADVGKLEDVFEALSACAALHPGPDDSDEEGGGVMGGMMGGGLGMMGGLGLGDGGLGGLGNGTHDGGPVPGQFDDPDEDDA